MAAGSVRAGSVLREGCAQLFCGLQRGTVLSLIVDERRARHDKHEGGAVTRGGRLVEDGEQLPRGGSEVARA